MARKTTKTQPTTLEAAIAASPMEAAERRPNPGFTLVVSTLAQGAGYRLEEFAGRGTTRRRVFCSEYDSLAEMRGFISEAGLDLAEWTPQAMPRA